MASDAGDDTGRSFERALERVATSLALHQIREAARSQSEDPEAADGRPESRQTGKQGTTTFVSVPMDDERQRDQVTDALRARGVECEAVDGATGEPSVVIAERDRGQAVDAARELVLEARRRRGAPTEERGIDLAQECRDMRRAAAEIAAGAPSRVVELDERAR